MSAGARYRRLYADEWHAAPFRGLNSEARVVYLYASCGPQTTSVGCFRLSTAVAVEDLGGTPEAFECALSVVVEAFGWAWDPLSRVLWMPDWFAKNQPASPNVVASWAKLLKNVPNCDVRTQAIRDINQALKNLPKSFREPWLELSKTFSVSESEPQIRSETNQGTGNRGAERSGNRGAGALRRKSGNDEKPADAGRSNEPTNKRTVKLEELARKSLSFGDQNGELETLLDTFFVVARSEHVQDVSRHEAVGALTAVLAERRSIA